MCPSSYHIISTNVDVYCRHQKSRTLDVHSQERSINILSPPSGMPSTAHRPASTTSIIMTHDILMPRRLPGPSEVINAWRLGEINTKCTHVEAVEEARKVLVEAGD